MKNSLTIMIVALLVALPVSATGTLEGKIIALDAGHGAADTGATGYCSGVPAREVDVNLAVREELAALLVGAGATAYPVPQLSSRRDRVAKAEEAGSDVLISIHHNGSTNTNTDYTRSFVTQKNDKEFAKYIHPALASAFGPDRGIKNDGYGMTVYGSLPGILTETYFITNTVAACDFLNYQSYKKSGANVTGTRVYREAQAMYNGLLGYFSR